MTETEPFDSEPLLKRVVALCHERRAEDVIALDVRELVEYMDYLVIATGRSERQNRAIAVNVARALKREGQPALSQAGAEEGAWICLDFVHVVLHVFTGEMRTHYDLELLWADAGNVDLPAPAPIEADEGYEDDGAAEAEVIIEPDEAVESDEADAVVESTKVDETGEVDEKTDSA